jgi:hypothetical protein
MADGGGLTSFWDAITTGPGGHSWGNTLTGQDYDTTPQGQETLRNLHAQGYLGEGDVSQGIVEPRFGLGAILQKFGVLGPPTPIPASPMERYAYKQGQAEQQTEQERLEDRKTAREQRIFNQHIDAMREGRESASLGIFPESIQDQFSEGERKSLSDLVAQHKTDNENKAALFSANYNLANARLQLARDRDKALNQPDPLKQQQAIMEYAASVERMTSGAQAMLRMYNKMLVDPDSRLTDTQKADIAQRVKETQMEIDRVRTSYIPPKWDPHGALGPAWRGNYASEGGPPPTSYGKTVPEIMSRLNPDPNAAPGAMGSGLPAPSSLPDYMINAGGQ